MVHCDLWSMALVQGLQLALWTKVQATCGSHFNELSCMIVGSSAWEGVLGVLIKFFGNI